MIKFKNAEDLVQQVNSALGEFCNEFGRVRRNLTGNSRLPKRGQLFTYPKGSDRLWAINEGGGNEIQYHITLNDDYTVIRYGLGFNTQYVPFNNNESSVGYMKPYMDSFINNEHTLTTLLPDYTFFYADREFLISPEKDKYALWGKSVEVQTKQGEYFIEDEKFDEIISDLKKQLQAYKIIFEGRNKLEDF